MTHPTATLDSQARERTTSGGARYKPILAAVGIYLLAAFIALSGLMKLSGASTAMLAGLGVPAWAVPVIGALELAGAVGLVVARLRFLAASGLTLVMAGAVATHWLNADLVGWLVPFALGVLFAVVAGTARPAHLARNPAPAPAP